MKEVNLNICERCKGYEYEGPRYIRLGPYSGEEFRKEHLLPWLSALDEQTVATIDFRGTKVYSPSFLEESFGGSIREAETSQEAEKNRRKLQLAEFINIDPDWRKKLNGYIENAKYKAKGNNNTQ